ncbi:MAG: hypothetical protein ACXVEE_39750 [Polyangiales bacterium]
MISTTPAARLRAALGALLLALLPSTARAQEEPGRSPEDLPKPTDEGYEKNTIGGEFTPAKGFDIVKVPLASLNISFYGLFRYVNQLPPNQTFTDHLGRVRDVKSRNDMNWHRTMVWLTGHFFVPEFRYNITLWSLPTTQQTLLFGNLQYRFGRALTFGVGILPNLTARSMQGSWPFWAGSDRQMSEEFFRGGFSSGVYISGEPISRFFYALSLNSNLSQLGVVAQNDSREMAYSASLYCMPTTGEFGPRGGFGDLEYHEQFATRFGLSGGRSRESRYAELTLPPNATQIRLSDGVLPFEANALADGVTVNTLTYEEAAADVGFKYKGFTFQGEYYVRRLSNFDATGPLPLGSIFDHGFQAQAMHMVVPKLLGLYFTGGYVFDKFKRHPWELSGGASVYPSGTRSWRINLHVIRVERSPTGSSFGYYTAGQSGTTISLGTDILL